MRIRVENELLPIAILTILLVIIAAFVPSGVLRIIVSLPFLLFFPGYSLIAALFPKKKSLSPAERVALSFALSIAVVPSVGMLLNYTPLGVKVYPVLLSIAFFILATSAAAWYRRRTLPEEERFIVALSIPLGQWGGTPTWDRTLSIILALSVLAAIGTLGYVMATPTVGEKFTEFYILGPEGETSGYPKYLEVGEEARVIVGITNQEQREARYWVEVWINGAKSEVTVDGVKRDQIETDPLPDKGEWKQEVIFAPQAVGQEQRVEFLLYEEQKGSQPYRTAHFWIDAREIGEGYTEFYVLTCPTQVVVAEEAIAILAIVNHEGAHMGYRVEMWLEGQSVGQTDLIGVLEEARVERDARFVPQSEGTSLTLELLFYKSGEDQPYKKEIRIIDVMPAA